MLLYTYLYNTSYVARYVVASKILPFMMYALLNTHSVEWSRSPPSLMYRHVEPPIRTTAFCAEGCSGSAVAQQRTEDVTILCTPNISECYFATCRLLRLSGGWDGATLILPVLDLPLSDKARQDEIENRMKHVRRPDARRLETWLAD